jgi:predicted GTPase
MSKRRVLILGAAGRDFHNFNVFYRDNADYEVVGFTATQIPQIDGRRYPAVLAGKLYPEGLPIWPEDDMEKLIAEHNVDEVVLAYSDLNYVTCMNLSARAMSAGADFKILNPDDTMVASTKPVIAVCAVRTGCGKSQTARYISRVLREAGLKTVAVRHPMPYGDLAKQAVQRFENYDDLAAHDCTIEEREEYESHIESGNIVYAGVDYEAILREAEKEADVVIWDGGNNDMPFYKPDLWITVADPLRPGHELSYFPGEVNFRRADVILINKANTADAGVVADLVARAKAINPRAEVIPAASEVTVEDPALVKGKRVVLIEDGPTLTHGEMPYGAGKVAAEKYEAAEVVDPRSVVVNTIKACYEKYTHLGKLIPAMGYFGEQIKDLEDSINAVDCDTVLVATPIDLGKLVNMTRPHVKAAYELVDMGDASLACTVKGFLKSHKLLNCGDGGCCCKDK